MKFREYLASLFVIASLYFCGPEPATKPDIPQISDVSQDSTEDAGRDSEITDNQNDDINGPSCEKCDFSPKTVFFLSQKLAQDSEDNYVVVDGGRVYITLEKDGKAFPFSASVDGDQLVLTSEGDVFYMGNSGSATITVSQSGNSKLLLNDNGLIMEFPVSIFEQVEKHDIKYTNYRGTAFFAVASLVFQGASGEMLDEGHSVVYLLIDKEGNNPTKNVSFSPVIITTKGAYFYMEVSDNDQLLHHEVFYLKEGEKYTSNYKLDLDGNQISIALFSANNLINKNCLDSSFVLKYTDSNNQETTINIKPNESVKIGDRFIYFLNGLAKDDTNKDDFAYIQIFNNSPDKATHSQLAFLTNGQPLLDPFWVNKVVATNNLSFEGSKLELVGSHTENVCSKKSLLSPTPEQEEFTSLCKNLERKLNDNDKRSKFVIKRQIIGGRIISK